MSRKFYIYNKNTGVKELWTDTYFGSLIINGTTYDWDNRPNSVDLSNLILAYIDQLITNTTSYTPQWNAEGSKNKWNYIDGVFMNSLVNLYKQTNDDKYKEFFIKYINYYINDSGTFVNPSSGAATYTATELDSVCESKILFDAYQFTGDERYLTGIEFTYNNLINSNNIPITANGINFSHKLSYVDQVWCDGIYMYMPFLCRYALLHNNPTITLGNITAPILDVIKLQLQYIREHMKDESGLYRHAHDTKVLAGGTKEFWADATTGNSANVWLRATCWLFVALVDSLEYYPEGTNKEYLKDMFSELAQSFIPYIDSDANMLYQLPVLSPTLTSGSTQNYLESSGSSMVAYAFMKGARCKYLNETFLNLGVNIFKGTFNHSLYDKTNNVLVNNDTTSIELRDICITAGFPNTGSTASNASGKDGSVKYYLEVATVGSDDAKGTGPFIMAYLQYRERNNQTCKVTFKDDENLLVTNSIIVDKGSSIWKPIIKDIDTLSFDKWTLNGEEFDFTNPINSDIILEANWITKTYHTVTFISDNIVIETEDIEHGKLLTEPTNPSKSGYKFVGWMYNDNIFTFDTPILEPITLVASWEERIIEEVNIDLTQLTGLGTQQITLDGIIFEGNSSSDTYKTVDANAYGLWLNGATSASRFISITPEYDLTLSGTVYATSSRIIAISTTAEKATSSSTGAISFSSKTNTSFSYSLTAGTTYYLVTSGSVYIKELKYI